MEERGGGGSASKRVGEREESKVLHMLMMPATEQEESYAIHVVISTTTRGQAWVTCVVGDLILPKNEGSTLLD